MYQATIKYASLKDSPEVYSIFKKPDPLSGCPGLDKFTN